MTQLLRKLPFARTCIATTSSFCRISPQTARNGRSASRTYRNASSGDSSTSRRLPTWRAVLRFFGAVGLSRVAKDVWSLSERAEIDSKITFLASVYKVDKQTQNRIKKMIERVRKMRNRLVHYKDEPTIVNPRRLDRTVSEGRPFLETLMEAMPDPEIVSGGMKS